MMKTLFLQAPSELVAVAREALRDVNAHALFDVVQDRLREGLEFFYFLRERKGHAH